MDLEKTLLSRRSTRAFRREPVPAPVLRTLVELASWAPSAANTQPWHFTVASGVALQTLRDALRRAAAADPVGKPEMRWPASLPERFTARRLEVGNAVLQAQGIAADDKAAKEAWFLRGIGFFDAPQVIVVSIERVWTELAVLDVGAVAMALQLAAHARGLGTCPQIAPLRYPWLVHQALGIPETERVVLTLPIGYPDPEAPVNHFRRTRVPADQLTRWVDTAP